MKSAVRLMLMAAAVLTAGAAEPVAPMPPAVKAVVNRTCAKCHSAAMRKWPETPRMLETACASVRAGIMPPPAYVALKPEVRLTKKEAAEFCEWAAPVGGRTLAALR